MRTRSHALASPRGVSHRTGRERGWASRRQASLASCRRHIVRVRRAWSAVVCPLSPSTACASRPRKKTGFSALRLARSGSDDVAVVDPRDTPDGSRRSSTGISGLPWRARQRGETCTRGETPTRWNARIYRRREHWPYGCSSETESGAVTSGLLAVSREGRRGRGGEAAAQERTEGRRELGNRGGKEDSGKGEGERFPPVVVVVVLSLLSRERKEREGKRKGVVAERVTVVRPRSVFPTSSIVVVYRSPFLVAVLVVVVVVVAIGGGGGGADGGAGGIGLVVQWVLSRCVQEVASGRDVAPRGRCCWAKIHTRVARVRKAAGREGVRGFSGEEGALRPA
ncbi:hypothetical protein DBV15_03114 [Temnothorax longispinosus]|uniref:Uncharacterized protein n=1 Tax=Temnothorax longispinosus TaxID=300112 RepID=A0A4S2KIF4_9HYME|nr:hypothetical protein DBV15_03114 [Temnothorax longispinosus]